MGNKRNPQPEFKIYNNSVETKKLLDAVKSGLPSNIIVNTDNYNERKRNNYGDYVTYNQYRESDKLYNLGLYYKEYSKQMNNGTDKEAVHRASCLFFRDALLIKRNEPDYILQTLDCSMNLFD